MSKVTIKLRLDIIVPLVTIPVMLSIATVSPTITVLMLTSVFLLLGYFYHSFRNCTEHSRTQFFLFWTVSSIFWGFFVFEVYIMPFREVLLWENLLLATVGGLLVNNILSLRNRPGRIRKPLQQSYYKKDRDVSHVSVDIPEGRKRNSEGAFPESVEEMTAPSVPASEVTWVDSRPITDGKLSTWCKQCQMKQQPRSGHCKICNSCVNAWDHHNIWLDTCIGADNHKTYFTMLCQMIFCGYYGSQLSITTICTPEIYLNWFLVANDCRFIYIDFRSAISFVTICYTCILSTAVLMVTLYQVVLISQNVTQQEYRMARRYGWVQNFMMVQNNLNNQGFFVNWINFLLVGRKNEKSPRTPVL